MDVWMCAEGEPGLNGTRGRRGRRGEPGVNGTKGEKGDSVHVEDFDWTEILKNCTCMLLLITCTLIKLIQYMSGIGL